MLFKQKLVNKIERILSPLKRDLYKDYPYFHFEPKHLKNCKNIPTREDLMKVLPSGGIVAELGVSFGGFAQKIWELNNPSKLYLIDSWRGYSQAVSFKNQVKERFKAEISNGNVEVLQKDSIEAMNSFDDEFFDWVYLDTTHLFDQTQKELKAIFPKIKPGGFIAGHDYSQGNWIGGIRYGVKEAVRIFCIQENWELAYLTHELRNNASFAIRKIDPWK